MEVGRITQLTSNATNVIPITGVAKHRRGVMSAEKDKIRAKVLSEKVTNVEVPLDDGQIIDVRDGSVGGMLDAVSVEDTKHRMARMLIHCCYVHGTDEKVFDEADFDVLMQLPAGGTYKKCMDVINERMNLSTRKEDAKKD